MSEKYLEIVGIGFLFTKNYIYLILKTNYMYTV